MIVMQPIDANILNVALNHFSRVAILVTALMGATVTARIVLQLLLFGGASSYALILKDALTFFLTIALFPYLVHMAVDVSTSLATAIQARMDIAQADNAVNAYIDTFRTLASGYSFILDLGQYGIFHIAKAAYTVLLTLLIAIGPIVLFIATMFSGSGVSIYAKAILSLLLWPVVWNLLGVFAAEIMNGNQTTSLGTYCYWFVVRILQLFSPVFTVLLLNSLSASSAIQKTVGVALATKSGGLSLLKARRLR